MLVAKVNNLPVLEVNNILNENLIVQWLKFADVSEKSVKSYNKGVRRFFCYLSSKGITAPTVDDVYSWKLQLKADGKSASTINLYLTSTKLFFKFLNQRGLYNVDISHVKGCKISTEHKKDALTPEQGKRVLKSFDTSTLAGLRDRAMVTLMMCCGLRTIEVVRANVGDMVKSYGRTSLFVQGKGKDQKAECVMLPPTVEVMIKKYLQARGVTDVSAPLFAGIGNRNKDGRLTTTYVSRVVKTAFRAIGLDSDRLTAHSLRHSAATAMLLAGVELTKVQQILRHKNINTTLIYSHHLDRIDNHGEDAAAAAFVA